MKSIGFTNFRRFARLEPLQLAPITFFVGGNNAGKSTVVKAMMLLLDNLGARVLNTNSSNTIDTPAFLLDANRIHEVHIGTFGRALHKPYPEQKELVLEAEIDNYYFRYVLTGDTESKQANADIAKLEFTNKSSNVQYSFDFVKGEAVVLYNTAALKKFSREYDMMLNPQDLNELQTRLNVLLQQRTNTLAELRMYEGDVAQLARINANYKAIDKQIAQLRRIIGPFGGKSKTEYIEYKCPIQLDKTSDRSKLISELLYGISEKFEERRRIVVSNETGVVSISEPSDLTEQEKIFGRMVNREARLLSGVRMGNSIEYISAHAASQKVLFSIEDKNDYMASVIREYKQCRINKGDKEYLFITKWMAKDYLNIGFDFEIEPISGEAYTVNIINMQGETMPLADMGMGSIQMMLLLLKLATIIHEKRGDGCIVIVEEPEQNIHPKLQSKLAELFAEVNQEYKFRFVIETHSEYMIRKSQAMIACGEVSFENNPFKVFFFPEQGQPYDMVYLESGRFKESFDSGFFDESAKWTTQISKQEIANAPKQEFQWTEK